MHIPNSWNVSLVSLGSEGDSADLQGFWETSTLAQLRGLQAANQTPSRATLPSQPSSGLAHPTGLSEASEEMQAGPGRLWEMPQPQQLLYR